MHGEDGERPRMVEKTKRRHFIQDDDRMSVAADAADRGCIVFVKHPEKFGELSVGSCYAPRSFNHG